MKKSLVALSLLVLSNTSFAVTLDDVVSRNAQQDKDIHDTYVLANTKYTENAGKALEGEVRNNKADQLKIDAAQNKEIDTKVDKSVFSADQKRQDDAFNANVKEQKSRDAGQDEHITAVQNSAQIANEKADKGAVRMDGIEKQAGVLSNQIGKVEVRADVLEQGQRDINKQAEEDRTNINTRVDQVQGDATNAQNTADYGVGLAQDAKGAAVNAQNTADYAVGQTQQNHGDIVNLDTRVTQNTGTIQKNSNDIVNLDTRVTQNTGSIQKNSNDIVNNTKNISTNTKSIQKNANNIANHETRITNNETNIATNTSDIKKTQSTVIKQGKVINNHETRITNNSTNIQNLNNEFYQYQDVYNSNQVTTNNNIVNGDARTLQQSKSYTDRQAKRLDDKIDHNETKMHRAVAGAMAQANIPNVPGTTANFGMAMGNYSGQTAIAGGAHWNINNRVTTKATVSYDGESAGVGAGMSVGW